MKNSKPYMLQKTIFQESWWLDITAQNHWGEVSYESKAGKVNWVYAHRKRYRLINEIYLPPLTPYMGIYFGLNKEIGQVAKYKLLNEALPNLVENLPKYFRLKTNFLPEFDWWSPLYWMGFSQHTRYTSLLHNISDHDAIWKGFNNNIKRNIKRAEKNISVNKSYDGNKLYALFEKTMTNQDRKPGYSKKILIELCKEIEKRKCGFVLTGEDQHGIAHSGLLLVWDSSSAYYLVGGTDPELRESGAMPLTMWTAIKEASKYIDIFDFEGSMQQGIDRFVRSFGAIPVPYYNISYGLRSNTIVRQK